MMLGGYRFFNHNKKSVSVLQPMEGSNPIFQREHWITLLGILVLFVSVAGFKLDLTLGAFISIALLSLFRVADETKALKNVPWGIIVMVCGVSMLTNLIQKTGGYDLFTNYIAMFCDKNTTSAVIGFFAALASVYSSSSGVVLPTFLSLIPQLTAKIPGVDPINIASSISISAHLVDVSPLSTVGALCLASVIDAKENRVLFNKMLIWGLSMTIVATVLCYIFF
jgi:di/tricarboxylate transporter